MTKIRWIGQVLRSPLVALIMRLLVGASFIFAAVTKLPLHSQFVAIVQSYHLLPEPLATMYGLALPWAELLVGCYLIAGILIRPSAVITILISISFMVANASALSQGEQYCGSCFGEAVPLPVALALSVDVLIVIAALLLLMFGGRKQLLGFDSWYAGRKPKEGTSH